jgi:hypothetical protein
MQSFVSDFFGTKFASFVAEELHLDMIQKTIFALAFLLSLTVKPYTASAQVSSGTISGRVTDATGASLANARIELENIDTGQRVTATSDASGNYTFSDVPVGRYRIVTNGNPASTQSQEVAVELGRTTTVNINSPSGPRTDAAVSAEPVPIDMKTANVARNYNTRYIQYLPQPNIVDRNGNAFGAYNLSLLSEGVTSGAVGGSPGPSVSGSRPSSNNFHLDGIDNNSKINAGPAIYLSNEASNEFAVFHNQPSPLFGHSTGGKFNTIMRTGTNRVHGSVYDYLQNRNFNALDSSFRQLGITDNPRYDQNRMGGTIGIPLVSSKVFFFGNFEYIPLGFERPLGSISFAPTTAGFSTLAGLRGVNATNLGIFGSNTVGRVGDPSRITSVNGVTVPLGLYRTKREVGRTSMSAPGLSISHSAKKISSGCAICTTSWIRTLLGLVCLRSRLLVGIGT